MNAGFGREGAFAYIRGVAVWRAIEPLVERMRHMGQFLERCLSDANVETVGKLRLELQCRDDGNEVRIAAPLAKSVERTLDLPRARTHRSERVGYRLLGVIVGVDTDMVARDQFHHLADDLFDLVRKRTA